MTYFITGGAGFIGSTFVKKALSSGKRIVNLDALTYAGSVNNLEGVTEGENYRFIHASITDLKTVSQVFDDYQPIVVVNFAAESHVDRSIESSRTFIDTNIVGTHNMLEAARSYWNGLTQQAQTQFRFLQISTDEVFGSLCENEASFSEDSNYAPNNPYASSKASADHLVRAYNKTYGLPTLTTNTSNNYGPFQLAEKLIPMTINNALRGVSIPIYGNGKQKRDWLHVDDHCDALNDVIENGRPGEKYNVGAKNEIQNIDLVERICDMLDEMHPRSTCRYKDLIEFVVDRPGHDQRYAIDSRKIESELGWKPKTEFTTGLRHTVAWYLYQFQNRNRNFEK